MEIVTLPVVERKTDGDNKVDTDRLTDKLIDRMLDRQTDRQTETDRQTV